MTVFEFQARRVERISAALAHFVESTNVDKLDWRPPLERAATRSILAQIGECVLTNRYAAALLRGENPDYTPARDAPPPIAFADSHDAQSQTIASGQELAAAIRTVGEADLERTYPHWRGAIRGEVIMEMPYRNMAYHAGQVNYVQMLYGDTTFHLPPTWL